jgi:hypothetical protein
MENLRLISRECVIAAGYLAGDVRITSIAIVDVKKKHAVKDLMDRSGYLLRS